jgi:hypothetical protein
MWTAKNLKMLCSLSSLIPAQALVRRVRGNVAWDILGLFASTCLIAQGFTTPAKAVNPKHLEQLRATNACAGCDLTDAPLSGVNLQNVNLTAAKLDGANLQGANLTGANLMLLS